MLAMLKPGHLLCPSACSLRDQVRVTFNIACVSVEQQQRFFDPKHSSLTDAFGPRYVVATRGWLRHTSCRSLRHITEHVSLGDYQVTQAMQRFTTSASTKLTPGFDAVSLSSKGLTDSRQFLAMTPVRAELLRRVTHCMTEYARLVVPEN